MTEYPKKSHGIAAGRRRNAAKKRLRSRGAAREKAGVPFLSFSLSGIDVWSHFRFFLRFSFFVGFRCFMLLSAGGITRLLKQWLTR